METRFIISGGGTGGHIFPAIAIANALRKSFSDCKILFVGASGRMEMEKVPAAGYEIIGLPVQGFNRKNLIKNIPVVINLLISLIKARRIIRSFQPDVAIGVGGYASGPVMKAASAHHVPIVIQEQNSYPGVTNKLLADKASAICVAYSGLDKYFPKERIVMTGNPVRSGLFAKEEDKEEAYRLFQLDSHKKTILILGGSLGARTINNAVMAHLDAMVSHKEVQFIWQTGKFYFEEAKQAIVHYTENNLHTTAFIGQMDKAYLIADLVISRAGASSISELCLLGKPTLLVPSPNVAEDHQMKNALALVNKGAALLLKDADATAHLIEKALEVIYLDSELKQLSENILQLAEHNSAERIVDEIVKFLPHSKK